MVTLQEVIENELLSQEVIDCIPERCECGGEIQFTDSLRQIYCSNPKCFIKIASRLEAMAKAMKADGWGESTCINFCKRFKLASPYQVFGAEAGVKNGTLTCDSISALPKKMESICDPEKRRVQLWEVVKLAGIPSIETIAYKIFNGYDNLTAAFKDIEAGKVPFIAEKLGLKNAVSADSGVMANKIYETLLEYKDELLYGEKQFTIYKPEGVTIYFAITGSVDGYRNKGEFIKAVASRYSGRVNPMLLNSVSSKVDILIADGDTSSNKYTTAMRLNNSYIEKGLKSGAFTEDDIGDFASDGDLHPIGEKIFITTSSEVFERLDEVYG